MEVRSLFWDAAAPGVYPRWRRLSRLKIGNAGDLFNRDLVGYLYNAQLRNTVGEGQRLLLVGSVANAIATGDVVCGIGTKGAAIRPRKSIGDVLVRGVRGPLTHAALSDAGYDVSDVRFHLDPGLLADSVYAEQVSSVQSERGRVVFIPHYRERWRFRSSRSLKVVSIDCEPRDLAIEILRAEHVYASSLHGIVFAHALGRPCTLVAPATEEPEVKYRDYFASLSLGWRRPESLARALKQRKADSPLDVRKTLDDFDFPTVEDLQARGIVRAAEPAGN